MNMPGEEYMGDHDHGANRDGPCPGCEREERERVTTGSEPRPVAFTRCLFDGPGQWLPLLSSADVSYYRELVDWEVVEVVGSGHDEQTEDDFAAITRVLSQSPWFRDGPPHDLAPLARAVVEVVRKRTVAAVVEALRQEPDFHSHEVTDFIAERFNLSPSQEPGGTDGQ